MKRVEIVKVSSKNVKKYNRASGREINLAFGPAYAGEVDKKPVFLVGFTEVFKTTAEVWLLPLEGMEAVFDVARKVRTLIESVNVQRGYRRLQATIDLTNETNVRSIEYVGFKKECELSEYGPEGQPFGVYRR